MRRLLLLVPLLSLVGARCGEPPGNCTVSRSPRTGVATISCPDGTSVDVQPPGKDAVVPVASCTVKANGNGTHTIHCPDGSSTTVADGQDGEDGPQGPAGQRCSVVRDADAGYALLFCEDGSAAIIRDGASGVGCTAARNEDAGTVTLTCGDGSTATLSDGARGTDGADGAAGAQGQAGSSCTASRPADAGVTVISCEDGTSALIPDGMPGPAGDAGTVALEPEPPGVNCAAGGVRIGSGGSARYVCNGTTSQLLGVDAGPDQVVTEGAQVSLAGSTAAPVFGVRWEQLLGPAVALTDVHSPAARFTAPTYADPSRRHVVLQLLATDGQHLESDLVVVTLNKAPAAPGTAVSPASPGDDDELACEVTAASVDPEGDPVGYAFTWTRNGQPFSGETSAATRSTIAAALTSPGDRFECVVTAADGYGGRAAAPAEVRVAQPAGAGLPCSWTEVAYHPMTSLPAGAYVNNGGMNGQSVAAVGGRVAWEQTSDWNQLFLPPAYSASFDSAAVEAEVYLPVVPDGRGVNLGLMVDPAQYNDIVHGLEGSLWCGSSAAPLLAGAYQYASASTSWKCCSTGAPWQDHFPGGATTGLSCASVVGRWVTLRVEASRRLGQGRLLLDGVELLGFATDFDDSGIHPKLGAGGAGHGVPANVAFSNVRAYRGTCTP